MATEEEKDNALIKAEECLAQTMQTVNLLKSVIESNAPKVEFYDKFMDTGHSVPLKQVGGVFEYEIKVKGKFKRVSNQDIYKVLVQAGDVNEWHSLLQKGKQHGFVEVPKDCPDGKIRYSIQALPKAIPYIDKLLKSTYEVRDVKAIQQTKIAVAEQQEEVGFFLF